MSATHDEYGSKTTPELIYMVKLALVHAAGAVGRGAALVGVGVVGAGPPPPSMFPVGPELAPASGCTGSVCDGAILAAEVVVAIMVVVGAAVVSFSCWVVGVTTSTILVVVSIVTVAVVVSIALEVMSKMGDAVVASCCRSNVIWSCICRMRAMRMAISCASFRRCKTVSTSLLTSCSTMVRSLSASRLATFWRTVSSSWVIGVACVGPAVEKIQKK